METVKMVLAMSFFGAFMLACGAVVVWRVTRFVRMVWRRGDGESRAYFAAFGEAIAHNAKMGVALVLVGPFVVMFLFFDATWVAFWRWAFGY
ncbi:hypothetical protein ABT024_06965 [Streptomyces sp. NPDC002812]|uniref:hypothetical protein n=1 Tax=Streptomyces sp. NPDC002812 TaxID=3154434 RepID=UPI00331B32D2